MVVGRRPAAPRIAEKKMANIECMEKLANSFSKLPTVGSKTALRFAYSIINMNDKMLASLYITHYDKYVKVFTNDVDLFANKHEVINRRFTLVAL